MSIFLHIITVTKDDPDGVAATLRSSRKLRQHPGVLQTIVDGSSEPVRTQVQGMIPAEENVAYLWRDPDGIAAAFNHGINSADSEWVWFVNGRDEVHPDLDPGFLLRILEVTRSEVLMCEIEYLQSGARFSHPPLWALWPPLYWVPHPATVMRSRLFSRYGLFDERYRIAMDGELWVRFFAKNLPVDMLSIPLCRYDQEGVSSSDRVNVEREADRIILGNFALLFRLWITRGRFLLTAVRRYATSRIFSGKGY
jgi:hypothetical protein